MSALTDPKIIIALDFPNAEKALQFIDQLSPLECRLKVGKELFTAAGPDLIERLQAKRFEIFLDLKFHDIPNTVGAACRVAAELGVWMVNVHASGGLAMLMAAREAIDKASHQPLLIGVTLLSSLNQTDLMQVGITKPLEQQVLDLAQLANQARLDGLVCSSYEIKPLRERFNFCLVVPGIRPLNFDKGDQKRVMTPKDAMDAGANYLVIGRPITQALDPVATLQTIYSSLSGD